MSRKCIC